MATSSQIGQQHFSDTVGTHLPLGLVISLLGRILFTPQHYRELFAPKFCKLLKKTKLRDIIVKMTESPAVRKAGWLSKEGKRLKGRSRRYLILEGTRLSHHVKENGVATWEVDINEVRLSLGERPLQFLISAGGRSVAFFADSHDELLSWVSALKSASSILEDFYTIGRQLGKGSYGEVFLSTDKLTGDRFAVKIIQKNPNNRKQKKFIERERAIMTTVNHPNIVRTVDVFEGPTKLAIVSEFMEGGELFDLIIASQYFTESVSNLLTSFAFQFGFQMKNDNQPMMS